MFIKVGLPDEIFAPGTQGVLLGMQGAVFPNHFKLKQDEITLSKITLTFFLSFLFHKNYLVFEWANENKDE